MAKTLILVLYACLIASCACAGPVSYDDYKDILEIPYQIDPANIKPRLGLVETLHTLDLRGPVKAVTEPETAVSATGQPLSRQKVFDRSGQLIADKIYESGRPYSKLTYCFDPQGKILSSITGDLKLGGATKTLYLRNPRAFLTGFADVLPNGGRAPQMEQWKYDNHGRLIYYHPHVNEAMNSEEFRYRYDSKGRLTKQIRYHSARDPNAEVGFIWTHDDTSYRIRGRVTYVVADGYGYYKVRKDSKGRIAALQGPSFTQRISYNSAGNPLKVRIYWKDARSEIEYSYDRHGNLVRSRNELTQAGGIGKITTASYRYVYDSHGNWTSRTSSTGEKLVRKLEYY